MTLTTILLAILVWHFVGKDWWKEQKDYIERRTKELHARKSKKSEDEENR